MADLTKAFAQFFISEHATFSEFQKSLKESESKNAWVDAVVLFRSGMKKLSENDLTGYEDIKKANDSLRTVVLGSKEDVQQKAAQLTESITKFDNTKIEEQIESLKYQLGSLYDVLKENGMPVMENEEEFFDDDIDDEDEEQVSTATAVVDPAAVPVSEKPVPIVVEVTAVPMTQPTNPIPTSTEPTPVPPSSTPSVIPTEQPVAPTATKPTPTAVDSKSQPALPAKESAFEHGVSEARKRWKMGENAKNLARQIAEKELCEKSYSYVNRWMEGFNYGYSFEEQVKRDLEPNLFENEENKETK
jgi:hypothetical protein